MQLLTLPWVNIIFSFVFFKQITYPFGRLNYLLLATSCHLQNIRIQVFFCIPRESDWDKYKYFLFKDIWIIFSRVLYLIINFPKGSAWFYIALFIADFLCHLAIFGIRNLIFLLLCYLVLVDYKTFFSEFTLFFILALIIKPVFALFPCF